MDFGPKTFVENEICRRDAFVYIDRDGVEHLGIGFEPPDTPESGNKIHDAENGDCKRDSLQNSGVAHGWARHASRVSFSDRNDSLRPIALFEVLIAGFTQFCLCFGAGNFDVFAKVCAHLARASSRIVLNGDCDDERAI